MSLEMHDWMGVVGALTVLAAYFANLLGWVDSQHWPYPLANLIGAGMILVSLGFQPNLSCQVMEGSWAVISIFGLVWTIAGARILTMVRSD
jgi:hypothetical protein